MGEALDLAPVGGVEELGDSMRQWMDGRRGGVGLAHGARVRARPLMAVAASPIRMRAGPLTKINCEEGNSLRSVNHGRAADPLPVYLH